MKKGICPVCGTEFIDKYYNGKQFCSRKCASIGSAKKISEGRIGRFTGKDNPNYRDGGARICQQCGGEYFSYDKDLKYCSHSCYIEHNFGDSKREKERVRLEKIEKRKEIEARHAQGGMRKKKCKTCGVEFWGSSGRFHCDLHRMSTQKKEIECIVCGKKFTVRSSEQDKTCSPECDSKWKSIRQKGEKSHRWKGGLLSEAVLARRGIEYKEWRKQVFSRDEYTCALCGKKARKLAAHHIKKYSKFPELKIDVNNGITLCWPCHSKVNWKEEDYEEYFTSLVACRNEPVAGVHRPQRGRSPAADGTD
jgi:5-methylcytosine-specific restriction endonuclease McrA